MSAMQRSLIQDIIRGSIGFAVVSTTAFSVWAFAAGVFRHLGGELFLYVAIACVFLGLSGLLLGPLAGGMGRFYRAFLPAFLAYSVLWCVAWFGLKGRAGEWAGAWIGCLAFTWISMKVLGSAKGWVIAAGVLFLFHSAGYFAGDWAMYQYCKPKALTFAKNSSDWQQWMILGKLSWGFLYGLGFGAGIGWVFHQSRIEA
jgi:hypothetical protein